jgi:hypothetical protein
MESGVQNASGRDVGQEGDVGDGECRYFIPSCYVFRSLVLFFENFVRVLRRSLLDFPRLAISGQIWVPSRLLS